MGVLAEATVFFDILSFYEVKIALTEDTVFEWSCLNTGYCINVLKIMLY